MQGFNIFVGLLVLCLSSAVINGQFGEFCFKKSNEKSKYSSYDIFIECKKKINRVFPRSY